MHGLNNKRNNHKKKRKSRESPTDSYKSISRPNNDSELNTKTGKETPFQEKQDKVWIACNKKIGGTKMPSKSRTKMIDLLYKDPDSNNLIFIYRPWKHNRRKYKGCAGSTKSWSLNYDDLLVMSENDRQDEISKWVNRMKSVMQKYCGPSKKGRDAKYCKEHFLPMLPDKIKNIIKE